MPLQPPIDYSARLTPLSAVVDAYQGAQANKQNIAASRASQLRAENLTEQEKLETAKMQEIADLEDGIVFASAYRNAPTLEARQRIIQQELKDPNLDDDERLEFERLANLDIETGNQVIDSLGGELYQQLILRDPDRAPKQAKLDTVVRTVMVEGKPTDVLYNSQTGTPIRVLGESKPAGKGVSVNVGAGETEFAKAVGKLGAKTIEDNQTKIASNEKSLKSISAAESALEKLGDTPYTGALSGIASSIASFADAVGIDTEKFDTAQQLDGILTSIAIQGRVPGSGPDTDKDFENRKNALGSLDNTTETLKAKLALTRSVLDYENKYNKLLNSTLIQTNGDQAKTQEVMDAWTKKNPYKVPTLRDLGVGRAKDLEEGVTDWRDL